MSMRSFLIGGAAGLVVIAGTIHYTMADSARQLRLNQPYTLTALPMCDDKAKIDAVLGAWRDKGLVAFVELFNKYIQQPSSTELPSACVFTDVRARVARVGETYTVPGDEGPVQATAVEIAPYGDAFRYWGFLLDVQILPAAR